LLNVYNSRIGNDPDIKVIIYPDKSGKYPDEHKKEVFQKEKKFLIFAESQGWEKSREKSESANKHKD